jgi:hypothetical protein
MAPKEKCKPEYPARWKAGYSAAAKLYEPCQKVDNYLVRWRKERQNELKSTIALRV